jgi:hypothetical protein
MITMQAVPMYGPPSSSCHFGTGILPRLTSAPEYTCSRIGPLFTATGGIDFASVR